jgi:hypothetical protein
MDEIDAIGGRRFSEGTSADREIQRTLMELLNQLDGFDELGKVFFSEEMILFVNCLLIFSCGSAEVYSCLRTSPMVT